MATQTSAGSKTCCKCGRDVTAAKRMKDHGGRYWCIPCGEADQRKKMLTGGGLCAGCGESVGVSHMTEIGGMPYCDKCLKKRYARKGEASVPKFVLKFDLKRLIPSGGGAEGGRMKLLLILIIVLVVVSAAINSGFFR